MIINDLFLILKRDRMFLRFPQLVEEISLFILIEYFKVKLIVKNGKSGVESGFSTLNRKDFYRRILDEGILKEYGEWEERSSLYIILDRIFNEITNESVFYSIEQIFTALQHEEDFHYLANDYQSLIARMFLEAPESGQFLTPRVLTQLLIKTLDPQHGEQIYDPACGSSGFLLEAFKHINKQQEGVAQTLFVGADLSLFANILSFVSIILNGGKNFNLKRIDSLENRNSFQKYDVVISNPPFGMKVGDSFGNVEQNSEYLFLQHIMNKLKDNGRAGVILPEIFLYDKSRYCLQLRQKLFDSYNVEAIILLPSGVFLPYTGIKMIVLFFKQSIPSGYTWVYQVESEDKLTRKNRVNESMFDDFFKKLKNKTESDKSWIVYPNSDNNYIIEPRNPDHRIKNEDKLDLPEIYLNKLAYQQSEIGSNIKGLFREIYGSNRELEILKKHSPSTFKLKDVISSVGTKPLSIKNLSEKAVYPVYGGNGIIGRYDEYTHAGEFIVIGRVGYYCGNVRCVKGKMWVTSNAFAFTCLDSSVVYLPYLAKNLITKNLHELARGTAQPHISVGRILELEINLPPLNIQIQISDWIDKLEEKLIEQESLISAMNEENNKIKQSIYRRWVY